MDGLSLLLIAAGLVGCALLARLLSQGHRQVSDPILRGEAERMDAQIRVGLGCGGALAWLLLVAVLFVLAPVLGPLAAALIGW